MFSRFFLGKKRVRDQMVRNAAIQICGALNHVPGFMPNTLTTNEYFIGYIMGTGKIIGQISGYSKPIDRMNISRMIMTQIFGESIDASEILANALNKNKEERVLEFAADHAGLDFSEFFIQLEKDMKNNKPIKQLDVGLPRLREHVHITV